MILLKRKLYSKKDEEKEEVEFDYGKWNRPRVGFPGEVAVLGALGTAGAAYGGSKIAEKRAIKKAAKDTMKEATKVAMKKAMKVVGQTGKNGNVIKKEDVLKAFKNPEKATKLIQKYGEMDRVGKAVSDNLNKNMKKIKGRGAMIAGLPVLGLTLAGITDQEYKRLLFKYGPRRVEVGQVKLTQKKKKGK